MPQNSTVGDWTRVRSMFSRIRYRAVTNTNDSELNIIDFEERHQRRPKDAKTTGYIDSASPEEEGALTPLTELATATSLPSSSWIKGVYLCALGGAVILLLNVVLISVAAGLASKYPENTGISSAEVIHEGSCAVVQRWNAALHLLINILSTAILAASNYCMQVLVAPSREEVSRCHARNEWLDVGVPSLRNLGAIDPFRRWSWLVLLVTATPFHLLYNSVVFKSQATREYSYILAPSELDIVKISSLATPNLEECSDSAIGISWADLVEELATGSYQRLDRAQCTEFLERKYPSDTKALVALTDGLSLDSGGDRSILRGASTGGSPWSFNEGVMYFDPEDMSGLQLAGVDYTFSIKGLNGSVYFYNHNFTGAPCGNFSCSDLEETFQTIDQNRDWTSSQTLYYMRRYTSLDAQIDSESVSCLSNNITTSPIFNHPSAGRLQECVRLLTKERCRLHFSPIICIVVCLAGLVKVITMFLAARLDGRRRSPPFLTIGDAVSSFLNRPEPKSQDMCLMTRSDAQKQGCAEQEVKLRRLANRHLWLRAASPIRWLITLVLCLACLGVGGFLLNQASVGALRVVESSNVTAWWRLGFGIPDRSVTVTAFDGVPVLAAVIVANLPQFIVTISYYFYNNLLTSMLAAAEYSSYGEERKPLRASWPVKGSHQRSTYWLSVPLSYSIPLLVFYTALHWLISQSLFYIEFQPFNIYNQQQGRESSLGYSPIAIFCAIIVGSVMVCLLIGLGLRKLPSRMPLAGSCSLAISAACHPPNGEDLKTIALGPVMWGETSRRTESGDEDGEVQPGESERAHCSFSALEVKTPSSLKWCA
ncbi:hypothetical protein BJY04DRAFT_50215 [Aspergillus karnatakaensis]|uniref:uncharacterized protein n=1 Tax=Aspergillus karnatakaensis TaxID=1810916 RepID=UPI003CCD9E3F